MMRSSFGLIVIAAWKVDAHIKTDTAERSLKGAEHLGAHPRLDPPARQTVR
jgi:hypothetical protein